MSDWWRNAVIYQVYLRSFADSDGDGVGDLPGLISRLDYLAWLGVDAIWCTPVMVSPNRDYGYDVADYTAVDPALGTLDDVDTLIAEAGKRGLRVIFDLVPNHTSDQHPWFRDPRTRRDYYIWADKPNNWESSHHIPSWTYHPGVGRYYLHSYQPEQPDLNWRHPDVQHWFDGVLRFWLDRGIAGFRLDACYMMVKDRLLRDNPPARADDHEWDRNRGQRPVHSAHQHEVHDILRRWRRIADSYDPPRLLTGATWVPDLDELALYYGDGDELHLPQYFQLAFAKLECDALRGAVEAWLATVKPGATPLWLASSHDLSRFPTRWCDDEQGKTRLALTMLLTLPGACVLYQGDELGLSDTVIPPELVRDKAEPHRDGSRTPMPWEPVPAGGFTTGDPWLPLGDVRRCNVADQRGDPGSTLNLTRSLIALKGRLRGDYQPLTAPQNRWRYRRDPVTIDLDFSNWTAAVSG